MGIAAIEEMVASQAGGVDWVLVELTGVADPGKYGFLQTSHAVYHAYEASTAPIAKSFWTNEEMGDLILDGVICVVDSRNLEKVSYSLTVDEARLARLTVSMIATERGAA
jgi:G3E family GTPase